VCVGGGGGAAAGGVACVWMSVGDAAVGGAEWEVVVGWGEGSALCGGLFVFCLSYIACSAAAVSQRLGGGQRRGLARDLICLA
jgi:hypothetical protein